MDSSDRAIRLRSSARTSVGQVRENNEDSVRLWADDDFVVAVVADGMGGAAAGEEASRLAVEAIQDEMILPDQAKQPALQSLDDDMIVQRLSDSIRSANLNIVRRAAANPELRGMGTTVTMAFVRSGSAIVAHVGDSRAYLVDGNSGRITQITADHSFVEALVAAGHLTQEQAEEHPMRNVLYRALGQHEDVDIDIYEAHLRPGDRLLLCSDGLPRHVKAPEIARIVTKNIDPDVASQDLIDLANERGGEDNVSVILVTLEGGSDSAAAQQLAHAEDDDTLSLKSLNIASAIDAALANRDTDADKPLKLENSLDQAECAIRRVQGREGYDTLTPGR